MKCPASLRIALASLLAAAMLAACSAQRESQGALGPSPDYGAVRPPAIRPGLYFAGGGLFIVPIPLWSPPPVDVGELTQRAKTLAGPGTTRRQVVETLGDPRVSDESGRFDLFAQSWAEWHWFLLFPSILPMPVLPRPQFTVYALVSYDADARVDAVDAGVVGAGMDVLPDGVSDGAVLRAGDYVFVGSGPGLERGFVAVALERFLADRSSMSGGSGCALLVRDTAEPLPLFERPTTCFCDAVRIDDGATEWLGLMAAMLPTQQTKAPARTGPGAPAAQSGEPRPTGESPNTASLRLLYPLALTPGSHRVRFGSSRFEGEVAGSLTCVDAEISFATWDCEVEDWFWWFQRAFKGGAAPKWGKMTGNVAFSSEVSDGVPPYLVFVKKVGTWPSY